MNLGVSISAPGLERTVSDIKAIEPRAKTAASRTLSRAGIEGGNELRRLLSRPKKYDPFWGVVGAASVDGLARRTGGTARAVIATGRVYYGSGGEMFTVVAHPSKHVAHLEEGGEVHGNFWIPTAAAQTSAGVGKTYIKGAFFWPTKKMKKFKNGRPKNVWLVSSAKGSGGQRGRGRIKGQGPMLPQPRGLVFLKLKRESVTHRAHHSFRAMRNHLLSYMAVERNRLEAEIVRSA